MEETIAENAAELYWENARTALAKLAPEEPQNPSARCARVGGEPQDILTAAIDAGDSAAADAAEALDLLACYESPGRPANDSPDACMVVVVNAEDLATVIGKLRAATAHYR